MVRSFQGFLLGIALAVNFSSCSSKPVYTPVPENTVDVAKLVPEISVPPREFGVHKLREAGFSEPFIRALLKDYEDEERAKIVSMNVLGFLSSAADYSGHYS